MVEKESVDNDCFEVMVLEGYCRLEGYFIWLVLLLVKSKVTKNFVFSLKRTF